MNGGILASLSPAARGIVLASGSAVAYSPGEVIYRAPTEEVTGLVLAGVVRVYADESDG